MRHIYSPPKQTCTECKDFEVVVPDGRGFPPNIAKNRLKKRCKLKGCEGKIVYTAGISLTTRDKEEE